MPPTPIDPKLERLLHNFAVTARMATKGDSTKFDAARQALRDYVEEVRGFTRSDLADVAREAAKVFSYSEQDIAFATDLAVTRYLASRNKEKP